MYPEDYIFPLLVGAMVFIIVFSLVSAIKDAALPEFDCGKTEAMVWVDGSKEEAKCISVAELKEHEG